ncbi:hypothetical protein PUN28_016065 [Cardiocondyla obscurior]|uniref:Uncharacterized protein n=1 Tax=Cardiocondyla obscurior TaxID=286306 RepID=A0AAW2EQS3_9HYME
MGVVPGEAKFNAISRVDRCNYRFFNLLHNRLGLTMQFSYFRRFRGKDRKRRPERRKKKKRKKMSMQWGRKEERFHHLCFTRASRGRRGAVKNGLPGVLCNLSDRAVAPGNS